MQKKMHDLLLILSFLNSSETQVGILSSPPWTPDGCAMPPFPTLNLTHAGFFNNFKTVESHKPTTFF